MTGIAGVPPPRVPQSVPSAPSVTGQPETFVQVTCRGTPPHAGDITERRTLAGYTAAPQCNSDLVSVSGRSLYCSQNLRLMMQNTYIPVYLYDAARRNVTLIFDN